MFIRPLPKAVLVAPSSGLYDQGAVTSRAGLCVDVVPAPLGEHTKEHDYRVCIKRTFTFVPAVLKIFSFSNTCGRQQALTFLYSIMTLSFERTSS